MRFGRARTARFEASCPIEMTAAREASRSKIREDVARILIATMRGKQEAENIQPKFAHDGCCSARVVQRVALAPHIQLDVGVDPLPHSPSILARGTDQDEESPSTTTCFMTE